MTVLDTWAGKSEFGYTGSVSDGVAILYGSGMARKATVPAKALNALLAEFRGRTVPIGASRNAPEGSLGAWLQEHVSKTATASYIGPILLAERYAERVGKSDIRFLPRRRPAK